MESPGCPSPVSPTVAPYSPSARPHVLAIVVSLRRRGRSSVGARLFNQYAIILVNPVRYHQVKAQMGMVFIDWLTSPAGQAKIASYKVDSQQLFFPDYVKP